MDLTHIATQLLSDDTSTRLAGLAALEAQSDYFSLPPEVCRGLLLCLGHSRKAVQRGAAAQLVRFSRTHPELVAALTKKLADPDPRVRRSAGVALGQLGDAAPTVLEVVTRAAQSDDTGLSKAATGALEKLQAEIPSPSGRGLG